MERNRTFILGKVKNIEPSKRYGHVEITLISKNETGKDKDDLDELDKYETMKIKIVMEERLAKNIKTDEIILIEGELFEENNKLKIKANKVVNLFKEHRVYLKFPETEEVI